METYLDAIDNFLKESKPDFWKFYHWFQNMYWGNNSKIRHTTLNKDEVDFLNQINEEMGMAGADPNDIERKEGIIDQDQFHNRLASLKASNISFWQQYKK